MIFQKKYLLKKNDVLQKLESNVAQSARGVEYTDFISAQEKTPPNERP